jgi:hypothetical protein
LYESKEKYEINKYIKLSEKGVFEYAERRRGKLLLNIIHNETGEIKSVKKT